MAEMNGHFDFIFHFALRVSCFIPLVELHKLI